MRSLVKHLLLISLLTLSSVTWVPSSFSVDIGSDDSSDQFVGSDHQRQTSPSNGSNNSSQQGCDHCVWMQGDPCSSQYNAFACGRVTEGCSMGQEQRRQWFSSDDGLTWQDKGIICVGGAVSLDPGGALLRSAFARAVPAASIRIEPAGGVLAQIPAIFDSGQPQDLDPTTHQLGAFAVRLAPTASWRWDFGDGSTLETGISGSSYPQMAVSHIYHRSGRYQVLLTTTWRATYSIGSQGPFVVDGEITQESTTQVQVGQGRAVLTPSR
jgi:hypothetical protein